MQNKVYIIKCPDYTHIDKTMKKLITMMGGITQFVNEGDKIVLKVNLLRAAAPEKAVTTHPAVISAVGRLVKQAQAQALIADSPGSGYQYTKKTLQRIYKISKIYDAAEQAGIDVNMDTTYETVSNPHGKLIKRLEVITPIFRCDKVFNLCKLKTHVFMHMTGAIKNNFGIIPGLAKPGYHAKLSDKTRFADMLLDLAQYVKPCLTIMDAVVGMEGEGPGLGDPVQIGLLIASENQLAVDVVAGEIMGLKKENNPVLLQAEKRGLVPNKVEDVEIIGADLADIKINDFRFPAAIYANQGLGNINWWQKMLSPLFKDGLTQKPVVIKKKCTTCRACYYSCPVDAISMVDNKYAHINSKFCIRCYCCHEMCAYQAIKLKSNILYRVFVGRTKE